MAAPGILIRGNGEADTCRLDLYFHGQLFLESIFRRNLDLRGIRVFAVFVRPLAPQIFHCQVHAWGGRPEDIGTGAHSAFVRVVWLKFFVVNLDSADDEI